MSVERGGQPTKNAAPCGLAKPHQGTGLPDFLLMRDCAPKSALHNEGAERSLYLDKVIDRRIRLLTYILAHGTS